MKTVIIERGNNSKIKFAIWTALKPVLYGVFRLVWISRSTSKRWKKQETDLRTELSGARRQIKSLGKMLDDSQSFIKHLEKLNQKNWDELVELRKKCDNRSSAPTVTPTAKTKPNAKLSPAKAKAFADLDKLFTKPVNTDDATGI